VTTFREFWVRSTHFGRNWSWDESRGAKFFVVIYATFWQLRNGRFSPNLTTHNSVSCRWIRKDIFENCHFRGHLPPKSEIESRSNRHLTQSRLQVTGCTAKRYCLLRVVVQGAGSFRDEFPRWVSEIGLLFCVTYDCGATGRQNCPIFGFWPISPYKTLKTYLAVTSLQPRDYIAEWLQFFHVVVEGPKGCLPARESSCDFWQGSWDLQTCPNFRLWQMAIPIQNASTRRVRSGPKMSENTQFRGRMYFSTKYLCSYP